MHARATSPAVVAGSVEGGGIAQPAPPPGPPPSQYNNNHGNGNVVDGGGGGDGSKTSKPKVQVIEAVEKTKKRWELFWLNPRVLRIYTWFANHMHIYSRIVIAMYFINFSSTDIQIWTYNQDGYPWSSLIIIPCALMLCANVRVVWVAWILMLFAAYHSGSTVYDQFRLWWDGHGLYFNELMVKRLATLGCLSMLLGRAVLERNSNSKSTFAGLLLEDGNPSMAKNRAGLLLVARLLISLLFLFVGYTEIKRQLHGPIRHGNHIHKRPEGDGHDEIWAKFLQFVFSIPLSIGLWTKPVSRMLSVWCLLEAFICWRFWSQIAHGLGLGYAIHAREHFTVNVAVSGGLLLLQSWGAGKYSMDAYLKKNE